LNGCYSSLKKVVPFKLHSLRAWPLVVLLLLHDKLMVADKRQYSMYLADERQERSGDVMRSSWLIYMVILGSSSWQQALAASLFHFVESLFPEFQFHLLPSLLLSKQLIDEM
jgi:hypothetical protein